MKNFKNIIIISILLIVPILILYFNVNLFNILSSSVKENFENNYINICKNKPTQFYDITSGKIETYTLDKDQVNNCKYKCSEDISCDLYIINNELDDNTIDCTTYNIGDSFDASINCSNNKLPTNIYSLFNSYNGEGYIKKNVYNENKEKFKYIDYELDKTNLIIDKYNDITTELSDLKTNPTSDRNYLIELYNDVNLEINDLAEHLNLSKNMIYSNFVPNEFSADINKNYKLGNNNLDYNDMISRVNDLNSENKFSNAKKNITKNSLQYKFSLYLALVIILIISSIILVLYKVSDNISGMFFIGYFSFITLMLVILHFIFKI